MKGDKSLPLRQFINGPPSKPIGEDFRVTELTDRIAALRDVDQWFRAKGFGLILTQEDGEFWAHLFALDSLQVTVPKYGWGKTPEGAAQRARDRYKVEQEP